jgi:hypothetical protein
VDRERQDPADEREAPSPNDRRISDLATPGTLYFLHSLHYADSTFINNLKRQIHRPLADKCPQVVSSYESCR